MKKSHFLSYEVKLAGINIRTKAILINNIKLLSLTIAIMAFMLAIFSTLSKSLTDSYKTKMLYDITLDMRYANEDKIEEIKKLDGVTDCDGIYSEIGLSLKEQGTFLNVLYGIKENEIFK